LQWKPGFLRGIHFITTNGEGVGICHGEHAENSGRPKHRTSFLLPVALIYCLGYNMLERN